MLLGIFYSVSVSRLSLFFNFCGLTLFLLGLVFCWAFLFGFLLLSSVVTFSSDSESQQSLFTGPTGLATFNLYSGQ